MAPRRAHLTAAQAFLLPVCSLAAQQQHTVAITVDDLPFASGAPAPQPAAEIQQAELTNRSLLNAFARHHVPATGFVIEQSAERLGLPGSRDILKQWTQPGFDLGNHLYSHPDVNTLSIPEIEQEITRGEATVAPLLQAVQRNPRFLRFPYNHTGDTRQKHDAIAAFMAAHGYRLAPCTIDTTDYEFNLAYTLALSRNDSNTAARAKADYIAYTAAEIDWYTALDKQVFGYEPPHIMLLHDSVLNAAAIESILALFDQRGYRYVSLSQATQDLAYSVPETYVTKYGPMWGYRWAQERHVQVDGRGEPDPPAWIAQYINEHQQKP